ncbi:MAG: EAL domain-containing protein [Pseudomonadota bacterium]|nr:EAL domain-containing protein [Pseudomonadota bacterium]
MKEFLIQRYRPDPSGPALHPTLVRVDDDGTVLKTDRHAEGMFGYDTGALNGEPLHRLLASRQDDPFTPTHWQQLERGQPLVVTCRHREGFFFTASLSLHMAVKDADQAASASLLMKDPGDMDKRLLRLVEQSASTGFWELDIPRNELHWSEGVYRLLDLRPGADLTPEQALFYCQNGQNRLRALTRRCIHTGQPFSVNLSVITNRQRSQRITLHGRALKQSGRVTKIGGVVVNHSAAAAEARERGQTRRILDATAAATPDLIVAVDTRFNLLHFNEAWAHQFRLAFEQSPEVGDNLHTLLQDYPDERRLIERLWQRAFDRDHFIAEMPLNRQGEGLPVYEFHFRCLRDEHQEVTGAIHVARDISHRVAWNAAQDDAPDGTRKRGSLKDHLQHNLDQGDQSPEQQLSQLRQALETGELFLEFQSLKPVTSATWGDHIEILCRVPGAADGQPPLTPDEFLPIAERFDLAKRLDRQVIRQTLDWLGRRPLLEPRLKYCGFNLSLASVLDDSFPDFMEQALFGSPFAAHCFCLDIQEAHARHYPDEVAALCDALHRIGCRVALEGAGASVESYSLVANLPVDMVKLDRRMMAHLEDDPVQQVMVDALHRIAEAAGKETVATFIENDDALRRVRALGVHFGQGFRLSHPQPLEELSPASVELSTGRVGG